MGLLVPNMKQFIVCIFEFLKELIIYNIYKYIFSKVLILILLKRN